MPPDDPAEAFVVVDADDHELATRSRAACHADPALIHRSVYVAVETAEGTLFQRRGRAKDTDPLAWDIACGGHVVPGETYAQAAARELAEELGLTGVEPEPLGRLLLESAHETELCTVFRLCHDGPFVLQLPEVSGLAVFIAPELPSPLSPSAKRIVNWLAAASRRAQGPSETGPQDHAAG